MKVSNFSDRLKEALALRGMSQTELAEKTGIGKGSISTYLRGTWKPKQDKVDLIAQALHVDPAWLMGYEAPMDNGIASYYTNVETATLAEKLRTNEDLRMLFKASENLTPEELKEAYNYVKYLKSKERR